MSEVTLSIRAHFDGKYIVPDEPVNLPLNAPLSVEIKNASTTSPHTSIDIEERLAALKRFTSFGENGLSIPAEKLRRENQYGPEER